MSDPFQAWFFPDPLHFDGADLARSHDPHGLVFPRLAGRQWEELVGHLRRHREDHLAHRPLSEILDSLDRVARRFLDAEDPLFEKALEGLTSLAGYSGPMAREVLEGMARGWTRDALWELIQSQFPTPEVLDGFWPDPRGRETRALGFPLSFHLGASTVPGVSTTSLIRALLVKSSVILKPGRGDAVLPVLFAQGLQEQDPDLAGNLGILYWPGDDRDRTEMVLASVDLVVAYGNDETVSWVRSRLPAQVPLRAYRHRMGFALVGRGSLIRGAGEGQNPEGAWSAAQGAARAIALFDQRGCVSPQVIFVEEGGEVGVTEWARLLARALQEVETVLPSGRVPSREAVAIQHLRAAGEVGEAMGRSLVLHGGSLAPWTVMVQTQGEVEPTCQNRTVRVIPVADGREALEELERWKAFLQTVVLEGFGHRTPAIRESLARLGVSRVTSLATAPWPPPWWHHDGGDPLRELVRWTDAEEGGFLSSGGA